MVTVRKSALAETFFMATRVPEFPRKADWGLSLVHADPAVLRACRRPDGQTI